MNNLEKLTGQEISWSDCITLELFQRNGLNDALRDYFTGFYHMVGNVSSDIGSRTPADITNDIRESSVRFNTHFNVFFN